MHQELRRHWLLGALQGLAATTVALLLLWALLPAIVDSPGTPSAADPTLTLQGRQFEAAVAARSGAEGDSMVVQAMQTAIRDGQRFGEAVWRIEQPGIAATDYTQLRLHLEGVQTDQQVVLFWRAADTPGQLQHTELLHDPDGVSWHSLWRFENWQGDLRELSVGVFGSPGSEPLRLHELALHGFNRHLVAQRLLTEWLRFQPWLQSSANRYAGVRGGALLHPAAAAGLWAVLALVLLALWQIWRRSPSGTWAVAGLWALLIPWLALDYLWQVQLERQLQDSRARYGSLTQAEKHTRAEDADLQRYAVRLHQKLQPLRQQRLLLLHDAYKGHDYTRLRLQFRLLPLNVYNYGNTLAAAEYLRPGDLVLLLYPVAAVRYNEARGLLDDGTQQLPATLLDAHPLGSLYRIEESGHAP